MSKSRPPIKAESKARLFDRFVCRVGGLPMEVLDGLRASTGRAILDRVLTLEDELAATAEPLADRLHQRIGGHGDKARRQGLIELRRRVFNRRPIDPDRLEFLAEDLRGDQLLEALNEFRAQQERLTEERAALDQAVAADQLAARQHLRQAVSHDDFVGALLLSSPALEQARVRTLKRPVERPRAKDRQTERGLLRYLTRAAAKATPFATFCTILPGHIVDHGEPSLNGSPIGFCGDPVAKRGLVRLNKAFLTVAQRHLVRDPAARRFLEVTVNPTLREDTDGRLVFLSLASGREVFQRLAPNPAIDRLVAELNGGGQSAQQLVRGLAADPELGADEATLAAYVDRLIDIGFLQLGTGVPAQALDWNSRFRRRLNDVDHPRVVQVKDWLADLERLAKELEAAPRSRRSGSLASIRSSVSEFGQTHGFNIQMNLQVFEDATAEARALLRRDSELEELETTLQHYVELTGRASLLRRDQAQLRHFFDTFYGSEVEKVPLLDLYEDYYRECYKAHLEWEASPQRAAEESYDLANPFGLDLVAGIEKARAALAECFADAWAAADPGPRSTIHLGREDLVEAVGDLLPLPDTTGWSVAFFCDVVPESGGKTRLMVRRGRYTTGFGKMFSRFLDLFPEEFAQRLRLRNDTGAGPDALPAELCDDANFNANLHPPLFSTEISYPPGETRGEGDSLLPTCLDVARAEGNPHLLELRHRDNGLKVTPVDTGFMNPAARPPLYRLLETFTPTTSAVLPMPLGLGPHAGSTPTVTVRPRVVYEDRLILHRRAFLVPHQEYPTRGETESDAEYWLRIERWRRQHHIPEQVYVRFGHPHGIAGYVELEAEEPLGPEWMKPQWIDFASPLMVDLFGRMAPKRSFLATLEECLPEPQSRPKSGSRTLAAEWILQLDFEPRTEDRISG